MVTDRIEGRGTDPEITKVGVMPPEEIRRVFFSSPELAKLQSQLNTLSRIYAKDYVETKNSRVDPADAYFGFESERLQIEDIFNRLHQVKERLNQITTRMKELTSKHMAKKIEEVDQDLGGKDIEELDELTKKLNSEEAEKKRLLDTLNKLKNKETENLEEAKMELDRANESIQVISEKLKALISKKVPKYGRISSKSQTEISNVTDLADLESRVKEIKDANQILVEELRHETDRVRELESVMAAFDLHKKIDEYKMKQTING